MPQFNVPKKTILGSLIALTVLLFACSKELSESFEPTPIDLSTKVTAAKVSGFVTDNANMPVKDAAVKIGLATTTTDKYGYFEVKNVEVIKDAGMVTVTKAGYFPGIRTFLAESGKSNFSRIKLITKAPIGSIDAATGGNVSTTAGLKIVLPANAVVNAASGAAYTGPVSVAAYWIDPTSEFINQEMPGDLRGINTGGNQQVLTTYGMAAVELIGSTGEKLQVASGKKATLTIPVPSSLASRAPSAIPMWHFDEATGLWKEEGSASFNGNVYTAEVSHFSFWNCDVPANYVDLSLTVKDNNGNPIAYMPVKISEVSNPANARYGYTDSSGYVHGLVPATTQLLVEVFSNYSCGTPIYSQTITTTNAPISLGIITVTIPPSLLANISATLKTCAGAPVTNGKLIVQHGYLYHIFSTNNTGTVAGSIVICNPGAATAIAEDVANGQQSGLINFTLAPGTNNLGIIQACGTSTAQFLNYTINGTNYSYTAPPDSLQLYPNFSGTNNFNSYQLIASTVPMASYSLIKFSSTGMAAGSTQTMLYMKFNEMTDSCTNALPVTITEYGAVGQFVAGNFNGTVNYFNTPTTTLTVSGSFRVRRTF